MEESWGKEGSVRQKLAAPRKSFVQKVALCGIKRLGTAYNIIQDDVEIKKVHFT